MTNREWIAKGNTGCTFATLFAKNPETVGWKFISPKEYRLRLFSNDALILSIVFNPDMYNQQSVKEWALQNGFYLERTSDNTEGLRIKCEEGVSWVQYFGMDSHVSTRRTPFPMLMFTRKLGKSYYIKVGFNGLLHLAHAWYDKINTRVYDLLWKRSYEQTRKKLGQSPDITQAAKTTFLK
jgi:hypothetical protein